MVLSLSASATIANITGVDAGVDKSPPYELQSITVGGYTVTRAEIQVPAYTEALPGGTDTAGNFFGTWDPPYTQDTSPLNNYDLHDILARNANDNPVIVKWFGGMLFQDINGPNPDFFIIEAASGTFGDPAVTVQAILPGGILGQEVLIGDTAAWGDTGLTRAANPNINQKLRGVAFDVTDLLDESGVNLTSDQQLEGLQINSTGIDPSFVGAVMVPEPSTLTLGLLGLGWFLLRRRR